MAWPAPAHRPALPSGPALTARATPWGQRWPSGGTGPSGRSRPPPIRKDRSTICCFGAWPVPGRFTAWRWGNTPRTRLHLSSPWPSSGMAHATTPSQQPKSPRLPPPWARRACACSVSSCKAPEQRPPLRPGSGLGEAHRQGPPGWHSFLSAEEREMGRAQNTCAPPSPAPPQRWPAITAKTDRSGRNAVMAEKQGSVSPPNCRTQGRCR